MADTKLSALTELAATPANDDEVYIRDVSEAAAAESKRITIANLMAAAGGGLAITTGSYTGDNTANRAIAHGLGVVPDFVWINYQGSLTCFEMNGIGRIENITNNVGYVVTAPTTTNFYVGNATSYNNSANAAVVWQWLAIG